MSAAPISASDGVRRANMGRLLSQVHLHGPMSRSALRSATGLNRSTIGTLVSELVSRGLVEEVAPDGPLPPGRPSPVVRPDPRGLVVLAVEVQVESVTCALVGIGGRVYAAARLARSADRIRVEETIDDVTALVEQVRRSAPGCRPRAVGLGVAGVVSEADGVVHHAPNLGWRDVPLADLLRPRLEIDVPVGVWNEADAGGLAEHARGAGSGAAHLVYVHCEVGLGAGVIVDGRLLRGADGFAGEVGHMPVNPDGIACSCGSSGCWETEAGERALLRAAGLDPAGPDAVDRLLAAAAGAQPGALAALERTGRWVGYGLAALVNVFNPELIVLGGLFAQLEPWLRRPLRAQLRSSARLPSGDHIRVVPSALQSWGTLLGTAELALGPFVDDPGVVALRDGATGDPAPAPVRVFDSETLAAHLPVDPPPPASAPRLSAPRLSAP